MKISTTTARIEKAAALISEADGLPDFRGAEGFWGHYPALRASGISFEEIASHKDPYQSALQWWMP